MYTISLNTKYLHIITHFTVFTKYRTDHLFSVKYREVDSAIYRLCLKYSAKYSYCLSAIYSISQNNFVKYRFRCEFRKIQDSAKYNKPYYNKPKPLRDKIARRCFAVLLKTHNDFEHVQDKTTLSGRFVNGILFTKLTTWRERKPQLLKVSVYF